MKRTFALLGSAIFLVIAPGTLAVLIPRWITRWQFQPPLLGFSGLRTLGVVLIVLGLPVLLDSFARFALQGLGTPAPVAPPSRLVVTGFYRYVRNPMYVAVLSLILVNICGLPIYCQRAGERPLFSDECLREYALKQL